MVESSKPRQQLSRERIIAAALELVEEDGLKGLTMRALGERLSVEAMAIYHYFPSKEALLEAVAGVGRDVEAAFGAFFDDMAASGASAGETVIALGLRYIEFAETHPAQFTLLFNTLPIEFDTWEGFMTGPTTFQIPQRAVQAGIDAGEFHPRPGYGRDEMAFNLWALVHGLAVLRQTRLRSLDADYDRLHRALLGAMVEQFAWGGAG
jgi:AcrR family transcriptional regulator